MPATLQPVIVTPSLPLLLAFYKALLGAAEISRVPEDGPAFYVGLQIGNAELGVVADGDADVTAPQRILTVGRSRSRATSHRANKLNGLALLRHGGRRSCPALAAEGIGISHPERLVARPSVPGASRTPAHP
jgi:hypothetical protein